MSAPLLGSRLPSLTLPQLGEKEKLYCGPYALSVITGKTPQQILGAFEVFRGTTNISVSTWKECKLILNACGMELVEKPIPFGYTRLSIRTLFETYNDLSNILREETCFVRVGHHFIVIKEGRLTCSITKRWCGYTDPNYVRKQVTHIAIVRQLS